MMCVEVCEIISYVQLCPGLMPRAIRAGSLFKTSCVSSVLQNCMDTEITNIYILSSTDYNGINAFQPIYF